MANEVKLAIKELRAAADTATTVLERISITSERVSGKTPSALVGTLGGFVGMSIAYAIALGVAGTSLAILAPICTGLCLVGSLLVYRGPRRLALDRGFEERERVRHDILKQLKQLPKSAPQEVRTALWLAYADFAVPLRYKRTQLALPAPQGEPAQRLLEDHTTVRGADVPVNPG